MDHAEDQPPDPARPPPQAFQRTIILSSRPGRVEGRVEDNVHDFSVAIAHDGVVVQGIIGGAHRVPWTSCPFAVQPLIALVGTPLGGGGPKIDQSQQCTHLFDLARLAIAHAARGGERRYDIDVAAESQPGAARARLWRDGVLTLDWRLQDDVVTAGDLFVGHRTSGRAVWPVALEQRPDLIEAGLILRRCLFVFRRRRRANADVARASALPHMVGACFSFQPERVEKAVRPEDFVDYPQAPIRGRLVAHTHHR
jgi:hypothetical protein